MGLRINETVPNFTADTTEGTIDFHDWIGDSYAILFSHPKRLHPGLHNRVRRRLSARLDDEWTKRGTKVIGVSVHRRRVPIT